MSKFIVIHRKDINNVGDMASNPLQYFLKPEEYQTIDVTELGKVPYKSDIPIIVGGGGLLANEFINEKISKIFSSSDKNALSYLWSARWDSTNPSNKLLCDEFTKEYQTLIKKYIDTYNYTSVCKNCNKEFGVDVKLNNIGVIARFNQYCSEKCIKDLIVKNKKLYRRKRRITYGRIEKDKEIAEHFGIKYEFIQRRIVYTKHKYICTSCGVKCVHPNKDNYNQSNAATLDHIIPKSKGGSHTYDNVTLLCRSCNTMKSDKLLNDYKRNIGQMEIEFTSYIPQGSQLQLRFQ
jgi:5-methylcytosine-specific restriction endonuclease McrA